MFASFFSDVWIGVGDRHGKLILPHFTPFRFGKKTRSTVSTHRSMVLFQSISNFSPAWLISRIRTQTRDGWFKAAACPYLEGLPIREAHVQCLNTQTGLPIERGGQFLYILDLLSQPKDFQSSFFWFFHLTLPIMENDYEKQHKDHVENTYTEDGAETVDPYAQHTLKRQLKNRHIAMISIGGVIGIVSFYKPSHKLQENSFIDRWYVIHQ